ncbi:prolyl oligopeptidase family serine peptidase [Gimesia benthica]|uniref:Prolyl oligopeptidase family serine peptidase n=1 Tax=Gimesia benthica TaxID=2608982 RepID=A0A6I6ADP1_9PLAN|nr:prolyl oligopeptidase family serine peptidase [Gimesia benthica]QGQ24674.1 prolyl oligopeptidase family serine peptidase [Gimesia benthica]
MKFIKNKFLIVFFWVMANLVALTVMRNQERQEIHAKGLDPDLISKFESITYSRSTPNDKSQIPFHAKFLKPVNVKDHQKYPLIVFLHGAGERGDDNLVHLKTLPQQMATSSWQERFPCYLLAPQCPENMQWSSSLRLNDALEHNLLDQIYHMILDVSTKHAIDPKRIYITGYSMGGYGTWSMIARYPELFAAASPICGGGDPNNVSEYTSLPLWVVHGDADHSVPVTESRKMIDALRKVGSTPEYYELKGVGHDSWSESYKNSSGMIDWLFKQHQ